MADRSFSQSVSGSRSLATRPGRPLVLYTADSKAGEARLTMMIAAFIRGYDVDFSGQTGNPGGTGVGGSGSGFASTGGAIDLNNPQRVAAELAALKAYTAAGRVVDYSHRGFTNEPIRTAGEIFANFVRWQNDVPRKGGARYTLIWAPEPVSHDAAYNNKMESLARLLQQHAAENWWDTIYINSTIYMVDPDPANVEGRPIPYTFNAGGGAPDGSHTKDRTHKTFHGCYAQWPAADDFMRVIYRRKQPLSLAKTDFYSAASPRGNIGGAAQRAVKMGGGGGLTVGTGTVTGSAPAGTWLTGVLTGNLSVAFTEATRTIDRDDGPIPRGTWPVVRATLTGRTDTSRTDFGALIEIAQSQFYTEISPALVAGTPLVPETLLYLENLVGLQAVTMSNDGWFGWDKFGSTNLAAGDVSPRGGFINDRITGPLWITADGITKNNNQNNLAKTKTSIFFPPDKDLTGGVIDFFIVTRLGTAEPVPAAAV